MKDVFFLFFNFTFKKLFPKSPLLPIIRVGFTVATHATLPPPVDKKCQQVRQTYESQKCLKMEVIELYMIIYNILAIYRFVL
jgi:hypothetical protein